MRRTEFIKEGISTRNAVSNATGKNVDPLQTVLLEIVSDFSGHRFPNIFPRKCSHRKFQILRIAQGQYDFMRALEE